MNLIKEKSVNTNEPLECVVQDYAPETEISEIGEVNKVESIRDIFARRRRNILMHPQEFTNSDIPEALKITTDGKEFLFFDNGMNNPERILVFTTSSFLETMHKSDVWLGDGSFFSCPTQFAQLYVLHEE